MFAFAQKDFSHTLFLTKNLNYDQEVSSLPGVAFIKNGKFVVTRKV
jgi:hypothetical protein